MTVDEIESLLHLIGATDAVKQLMTESQMRRLMHEPLHNLRLREYYTDKTGKNYLRTMAEQINNILKEDEHGEAKETDTTRGRGRLAPAVR